MGVKLDIIGGQNYNCPLNGVPVGQFRRSEVFADYPDDYNPKNVARLSVVSESSVVNETNKQQAPVPNTTCFIRQLELDALTFNVRPVTPEPNDEGVTVKNDCPKCRRRINCQVSLRGSRSY